MEPWSGLDPLLRPNVGTIVLFGNWEMIPPGFTFSNISNQTYYDQFSWHSLQVSIFSVNFSVFHCCYRFVEWIGCCCSGGGCENDSVKEQTCTPLCRDTHFQHPMRTKACEALALLPSSMPLYSGYKLSFSRLKFLAFHCAIKRSRNTNMKDWETGCMERLWYQPNLGGFAMPMPQIQILQTWVYQFAFR